MTDHPITPPPELVQQWCHEDGDEVITSPRWFQIVCAKAARWGSDQELKECCEWLKVQRWEALAIHLRATRRPKPPSLKELALEELRQISISPELGITYSALETIRRALEQLDD